MKREIEDFVKDILESIEDIASFTKEIDFDTFAKDKNSTFAVKAKNY